MLQRLASSRGTQICTELAIEGRRCVEAALASSAASMAQHRTLFRLSGLDSASTGLMLGQHSRQQQSGPFSAVDHMAINLQVSAPSRRTFASTPQFTAAGGNPIFTGGPDPRASDSAGHRSADSTGSNGRFGSSGSEKEPGGSWVGGIDDALQQIQLAALNHVKQLGWSNAALVAGARDVGVSPAITGSLENGGADLIELFLRRCKCELSERAAADADTLAELPLQQRLHTLIRWRLLMLQPYIDSWPQALGIMASPRHTPMALSQLNELVDEVWHAAGDTSMDFGWYAKRAALASIYSASELYMLTDYSAEYADTWSYLDRQLSTMLAVGDKLGLQMRA